MESKDGIDTNRFEHSASVTTTGFVDQIVIFLSHTEATFPLKTSTSFRPLITDVKFSTTAV